MTSSSISVFLSISSYVWQHQYPIWLLPLTVNMMNNGTPAQDQQNFVWTSQFFSFYLQLYKNEFKNLIRTSKFKFSYKNCFDSVSFLTFLRSSFLFLPTSDNTIIPYNFFFRFRFWTTFIIWSFKNKNIKLHSIVIIIVSIIFYNFWVIVTWVTSSLRSLNSDLYPRKLMCVSVKSFQTFTNGWGFHWSVHCNFQSLSCPLSLEVTIGEKKLCIWQ